MRLSILLGACSAALLAGGSAWAAAPPPPTPAFPNQTRAPKPATASAYQVKTVAFGLVKPYGLAFLPDSRFLISERAGRLRIVGPDGSISAPVKGLPDMSARDMLDVLIAPDFATSHVIYFSFLETRPDGYGYSIARGTLSEGQVRLDDVSIVYQARPSKPTKLMSGRLAWGCDGKLYTTVAAAGLEDNSPPSASDAQDLGAPGGKVLRLNPDGTLPAGNPFTKRPGALHEIYDMGHRDMQGLTVNPATGAFWLVEHGPQGGDELNIVQAGKNYGWPVISYGTQADNSPIGEGLTAKEGMEQPVYFWTPAVAPSGLMFYSGELFPQWRGDLFVGALRGKRLIRLVLNGDRVVAEEDLLQEENSRIRDVRQGPDGAIYVLTDEADGRLLKITPKG
jgi:glucose/arabinose dehydrogenase